MLLKLNISIEPRRKFSKPFTMGWRWDEWRDKLNSFLDKLGWFIFWRDYEGEEAP